jgi:diguanylate cyclase (GGDEF)-like protein/PAS domain S-box-containing protein
VVVAAACLFAAIFVGRALDGSSSSGLTILYVLPVVLVGVELGRRAGIAAGLVAFGLFSAWAPSSPVDVPISAYVTRAVVFAIVGAVAGHLADRLHAALASAHASARHFELTRDLLCTVTFEGYITHLNGSWEAILGWSREELMARPFTELVHPDDLERTQVEALRATRGDFSASFANRYRTKGGDWRWIEWSSQLDPDEQLIHAAARDVTDRMEAEQAQREAEERFRRAFDDSATGMAVVGVAAEQGEVLLDANDSLARIFGCERSELVGSRALADLIDPAHAPAVARGTERLLRGDDSVHRCECRMVRPDGVRIWLGLTASLVRDTQGAPLYRLVQVLDVTERKSAEERLRYLADHDPLSGVFNRRRFEQELQRELDRADGRHRRSVVLLFDVDDFKAINDMHGHATGDAVIARFGDVLRTRLRTTDVGARLGGDEFAILARRSDLAGATELAHSVQALAAEQLAGIVGDGNGQVTLSVGLALVGGEAGRTVDAVLGDADAALYEAKRAGKNRVAGGRSGDGVVLMQPTS